MRMQWKNLLLAVAVAVAVCFGFGGALQAADDVMQLNEPSYPHTKGPVEFSHKKHSTDYKAACGDCHHDDKGQPLAGLKDGDPVQKCVECHKKPGEVPKEIKKEWKDKKLKKEEADKLSLEYHAEALHENCRVCHRDHNKANNTQAAPTKCNDCHPKEK